MRNLKKFIPLFAVVVLSLISCTEDVNLSVISSTERKIVIEGNIENGKSAEVLVTRNSPISQPIDISAIFVSDAKVYVSNGTITDTLKYTLDPTGSLPFAYKGSSLLMGVAGQTYNLTVIADGKTFTATTTIPTPIKLDSVWWKIQPPEDSLGFAWAHLTDPAGPGNAYKWYAKRATKDRRYIAPYGSTFDDKFIDGKSFDFAYNRGSDPTASATASKEKETDRGFFRLGDTIYIKFCAIDPNTFKFYSTYEQALQTNGNPFASPVAISSNIKGGGLGVWGGLGTTYDTIYAHK